MDEIPEYTTVWFLCSSLLCNSKQNILSGEKLQAENYSLYLHPHSPSCHFALRCIQEQHDLFFIVESYTYSRCWEEKLSLNTFYIPDLYGGLYFKLPITYLFRPSVLCYSWSLLTHLFFPVWTVSNIRLKCFDSLYHQLHLSVYMWGLNIFKIMFYLGANMICFATKHSKFGVGGCCRLDLFSLNKIFFARIFKH